MAKPKRPKQAKKTVGSPSRATPKTAAGKQPPPAERSPGTKYAWAIILFFVSIYLTICIISYFFNWEADQNIALWQALLVRDSAEVQNWGGRLGATLSHLFVHRWFGFFGLCIPAMLFFLSFIVVGIKRFRPVHKLVSVFFLMIIGSVSAAWLFAHDPGMLGGGAGGTYGRFINEWLVALTGVTGAGVILLMLLAIWTVYSFRNAVSFIGKSMRALSSLFAVKEREHKPAPIPEITESIPELPAEEPVIFEEPDPASEITDNKKYHYDEESDSRTADLNLVMATDYAKNAMETQGRRDFESGATVIPLQPNAAQADEEEYVLLELPDQGQGKKSANGLDFEVFQGHTEENTPVDNGILIKEDELPHPIDTEVSGVRPAMTGEDDFIVEKNEMEKELDESEIDNSLYDPTRELSRYQKPPLDLLEKHEKPVNVTETELIANKNRIIATLENFNIKIDKIKATIGPTVTLYEIIPAPGIRISKIKNLEDDIALSLSALGIRIIAPIPGKGTIGIEVPNNEKEVVSMYSAIKSAKFQESDFDLPVVLGRTIQNENYVIDLAKMPHLLVAGATGQGKSVGLNAVITSLLYKKHPSEMKFVLVDPKKVELNLYARLEKHFLAKMPEEEEAIITDTQKVIYTLNSLCIEMDARYDLLKKAKVRNIKEYNNRFVSRRLNPENGHRFLPYFVVIIDEFADLIMTAGREIEMPISRIAQLARAVGIHLVIATQRPTTNIITGVIKANFPARIAFRVSSMIDSRTILDQPGANQLIGRGDMLISTGNEITRVQCAFVDTPEVERITDFIGNQRGYVSAYELPEYVPESTDRSEMSSDVMSRRDALFEEVARYVVTNQQGSASTIQRKFAIGFNRAGRLMDQLEATGIVGKQEGSKPRQVLVSELSSLEVMLYDLDRKN